MDFNLLIQNIKQTHDSLYKSVTKSVNAHLTLRNLLTGFYIVEFEQNGEDRAKYGTKLLQGIADKIKIKGLTTPELSRCRQFYTIYQPILGSATQEFNNILPTNILGSLTQELQKTDIEVDKAHYMKILSSVSYTHFVELLKIEDDLKRKFYELLILNSHLSVRELKRQIHSLAFERVGLSENKTLVEYAVAESDKEIFVSKYALQLPKKEDLELFINNELKNN